MTVAEMLPVHIRWMIRRDMPSVLDIENQNFDDPWTEEDFVRVLRQRNAIGMVAEHDDRVVGFMLYELRKRQIHLLNFAVAKNMHRLSVGRQMAEKLKSKLSTKRRNSIVLEIPESNLPGQQFFRQMGFVATSISKEYFQNSEDAFVMKYDCCIPQKKRLVKNRISSK